MAIDHRIALQVRPRTSTGIAEGIASAFGSIGDAIRERRREEQEKPLRDAILAQQKAQTAQAELELAQRQQQIGDATFMAKADDRLMRHNQAARTGDYSGVISNLESEREALVNRGAGTDRVDALLSQYRQGNFDVAGQALQNASTMQRNSAFKMQPDEFGLEVGDSVVPLVQGINQRTNEITYFNEKTGQEITPQQLQEGNLLTKGDLSVRRQVLADESRIKREQAVAEAGEKRQIAKELRGRVAESKAQIRDNSMARNRKKLIIRDIMSALDKEDVTTGIGGSLKVQLSKAFPNIDVSDESQVRSGLLRLTMDELQSFKGPTTDFEFGKAEEIAGTLGDSKEGIRAQNAQLERMLWAEEMSDNALKQWIKEKKDPSDFEFDIFGAAGQEPFKQSGKVFKTRSGDTLTVQEVYESAAAANMSVDQFLRAAK